MRWFTSKPDWLFGNGSEKEPYAPERGIPLDQLIRAIIKILPKGRTCYILGKRDYSFMIQVIRHSSGVFETTPHKVDYAKVSAVEVDEFMNEVQEILWLNAALKSKSKF